MTDSFKLVTVKKPSKDAKLGITLRSCNGLLVITRIAEDGVFAKSDLHAGMVVDRINGIDVTENTSFEQATWLIKQAESNVSIRATHPAYLTKLVTVKKPSKDAKLGITLKSDKGKIVISKIAEDGVFAQSGLKTNMVVIQINGIDIKNKTFPQATSLIKKKAESTVSILAVPPMTLFRHVTAKKPFKDAKLGIWLKSDKGKILVSKIAEDGVFAQSGLVAGMVVVRINDIDVSGMEFTQATQLVKEAESTVSIQAVFQAMHKVASSRPKPTQHPPPPPGCAPGGFWQIQKYQFGPTATGICLGSFLVIGFAGLLCLACEWDERRVYNVNGSLYTADGSCVGRSQRR